MRRHWRFPTRCGGLFLFLPDLVRLGLEQMADTARLPGSKMIPRTHALRACLALKLWAIERKSHVMALVADEGLGLFCGLNRIPKKSYLSEYSSRTTPKHTSALLGAWHMGVTFITLRRRSPKILAEIRDLPPLGLATHPPRRPRPKVSHPPSVGEERPARRVPLAPALHP